jgi:hypothetical protein
MIRLHLIAYVVLIFSFLLFLIGFIANNQIVLSVFTVIVGVANLGSELILVFIFNSIVSGEVHRTKTEKPEIMPQYAEKLIESADSSS